MIPGTKHFDPTADSEYSRIAMGVSWPAGRSGFVAVVGEHRIERIVGGPKLVVLDEATDRHLGAVVDLAAALRGYYHPEMAFADCAHVAALQFVAAWPALRFTPALLDVMPGPMGYALPVLKQMRDRGRLIVPVSSRLRGELLTAPVHEDPALLKLGDYPGIAALAYAVLGLERTRSDGQARPSRATWPGKVLG